MSTNRVTLHKQHIICVNYSSVTQLLQVAEQNGCNVMHLESRQRVFGNRTVWGVLLTARLGDEIHCAWVVTAQILLPNAAEAEQARAAQALVREQLVACVAQPPLQIAPGSYALAPESLLYQQVALLDLPSWSEQGGR